MWIGLFKLIGWNPHSTTVVAQNIENRISTRIRRKGLACCSKAVLGKNFPFCWKFNYFEFFSVLKQNQTKHVSSSSSSLLNLASSWSSIRMQIPSWCRIIIALQTSMPLWQFTPTKELPHRADFGSFDLQDPETFTPSHLLSWRISFQTYEPRWPFIPLGPHIKPSSILPISTRKFSPCKSRTLATMMMKSSKTQYAHKFAFLDLLKRAQMGFHHLLTQFLQHIQNGVSQMMNLESLVSVCSVMGLGL